MIHSKELKPKSLDELNALVHEYKQKLFALKFQNSLGKLTNPKQINYLKKDIARVFTEIQTRKNEPSENIAVSQKTESKKEETLKNQSKITKKVKAKKTANKAKPKKIAHKAKSKKTSKQAKTKKAKAKVGAKHE